MNVKFIICGHGHFATGLLSAFTLLCGDNHQFVALDFEAGDSFDNLVKAMENHLDSQSDTVICTDIKGGSPFKAAVLLKMKHHDIQVITGANLAMLLNFAYPSRDFNTLDDLIEDTLQVSTSSIENVDISI